MESGESFFISYCKPVKALEALQHGYTSLPASVTDLHLKCAKPWQSTEHTNIFPLSPVPVRQCSGKYSDPLHAIRNSSALTSCSAGRGRIRFHDSLLDMTNSIYIDKSIWNFTFAKCQLSPCLGRIRPDTCPFSSHPITVAKEKLHHLYSSSHHFLRVQSPTTFALPCYH